MLDFQNDRDATLKLIDWFQIDRVRQARVLVVGAGAIGNEVLKNLALLGVGHVYVFDMDTIEMSNLSRSVLYRPEDRGQSKAMTAARAVTSLNPVVNAFWHHGDIRTGLGEGFIRTMDAVIGCLDNRDARFWLNRLCRRAGRPWIDAAIDTLDGFVRVYPASKGPCYECKFTERTYAELSIRQPCNAVADAFADEGRVATTPTIASIVAGVQVQEALKLLNPGRWKGRNLVGRQFRFEGSDANATVIALTERPDCPAHVEIDETEIVDLDEMTADHSAGQLLDVARRVLGDDTTLSLFDEVALTRTCAGCRNELSLFRALNRVSKQELVCASCGRETAWQSDIDLTHVVTRSSPRSLLDARLIDLGVPRFGFVAALGPGGAGRVLTLAGDRLRVAQPA
jgi:molybdopterin/thiamine biosynthesis adenylyltransferase